jgi:hypothetical protein
MGVPIMTDRSTGGGCKNPFATSKTGRNVCVALWFTQLWSEDARLVESSHCAKQANTVLTDFSVQPFGKAFEGPAESRGKGSFPRLRESRLRPFVSDILR